MTSRLRLLGWYLRRPALYPDLGRRIIALGKSEPDTRNEAEAWCQSLALPAQQVLSRIGISTNYQSLEELYPQVMEEANSTASAIDSNMGGAAAISFIYHVAKSMQVAKALETGVAAGWSSLAILLQVASVKGGFLVSTDRPYPGRNNEHQVGVVVPEKYRGHWHIIRQADREAIPKAIRRYGPFDLVHYDSDKSFAGRKWAYRQLWGSLRPGGVFISDDVGDNLAFQRFVEANELEPLIVEEKSSHGTKYVGMVLKPMESEL